MQPQKTTADTDNDCPSCYGQKASFGNLPACSCCEYSESCKWYIDNPDPSPGWERMSTEHFTSFEAIQYSEEVAEIPAPEENADQPEDDGSDTPCFSPNDLRFLLEFLLRDVDDYSLAIVECALRSDCNSAADLARAFKVSREAMHRKLIDTCRAYPPLATVLRCVLHRCARLSNPDTREFIAGRRVQNTNKDPNQLEFKL